jgi:hypothetical protein
MPAGTVRGLVANRFEFIHSLAGPVERSEKDGKPDLSEEMRAATLMIRAMARTCQPSDLLRL